jgi:dUTP pyrophosphatase
MDFEIAVIMKLQRALNEMITPGWLEIRTVRDWSIACTAELQEAIDTQPWKWWKCYGVRPERLLLELIDVLHFSTSGHMTQVHCGHLSTDFVDAGTGASAGLDSASGPGAGLATSGTGIGDGTVNEARVEATARATARATAQATANTDIVSQLMDLMNKSIRAFSIGREEREPLFLSITNGVLKLAKDNKIPIIQNYFAKHCLNYIRQLKGYKNGTYIKPTNEDSVLFEAASLFDGNLTLPENYNIIASHLYDVYKIDFPLRNSYESWISLI